MMLQPTCSPRCTLRPAVSLLPTSTTRGLFRTAFQSPARLQKRSTLAGRPVASLGDVGNYLAEAASNIFKPGQSDVPWSGSTFSGRITHHDEVARLRRVYDMVKEARQTIQGCTDSAAANYNPAATADDGSCTYVFEDATGDAELSRNLENWLSSALKSLWGGNVKSSGGGGDQPKWEHTGYPYAGERVTQRDISRLLQYEQVVKAALDKAEAQADVKK